MASLKRLVYIFIPILAVLLMSHNTSAINTTFYLKHGIYAYGIPAQTGAQGGTNSNITSGSNYNYSNNIYSLPGNRIWYSMNFYFNAEHSRIDVSEYTDFTFSFSYCADNATSFIPSSNDYFLITDYYEFESDYNQLMIDNGSGYNIEFTGKCRNVLLRGKVLTTNALGFQLGTTNNQSFTRIFGNNGGNTSLTPYLFIISPTVVLYTQPNEADEAIQKEKQNVQNAADDSSTTGSSSSSDATAATSSLISVIGGFVNVLTSAQPTNCRINANLNHIDMGQLDLCANPVPSYVQIIGSIILICAAIPLAIVLFNRFIGLFRSFQG